MPEPTLKFDASLRRMTIEFHEPPSAETLAAISARLRNDEPRCVHAIVSDWNDPQAPDWDDPRHVSQLEKALNPSLEAFIFDAPLDTVARQSYNTLGDISDVLEACPALQRALITGCSTMRKTRHEQIHELHLMGSPLDPSVMTALTASTFPALEKLVLLEQDGLDAANLARCLRSVEAQRLSHVCIDGVPVFEFLPIIGTAALPWNLCLNDPGLDEVDELFAVLAKHKALRSGKLQLCSEKLFDSEIAQLAEVGVAVVDWRDIFLPQAYAQW